MTRLTCLFFLASTIGQAADRSASALPRGTPEAQGVSSAAIQAFVEAADQQIHEMNSFMLVRHGQVVAESWWTPYAAETPHTLYSLSKSFTSTAVGLAIAEGKLSLDDEVLKFFPEDAPAEPSKNLKAMRLRDLLCMSTGQQTEVRLADTEQPWVKAFLAHPVPHKPGAHFLYNTPATYMQSAIVQKLTGQTVLDYLRPRLFEPLGIENPTWGTSPQGISLGGYGLNLRTEDIAKFGQLFLQKGKWQDKQLVPAAWVEAATARQASNGSNPKSDWDQGYGYQFWRSQHGCYRGDGAFGQYCLVMPEQDAVVAITSGVKDMQAVLDLVWEKLLPAMQAAPLPPHEEAGKRLTQTLAGLKLRVPQGASASALVKKFAGQKFLFPANEQKLEALAVELGDDQTVTLAMRVNGVEQRIACGQGSWRKGRLAHGNQPEQPVAAAGAWSAEDTFAAKLCFYETPTVLTATLQFAGDRLHYQTEANVGFGQTKQAPLVGRSLALPTRIELAIPATDDGLAGAGPIRRQGWFRDLWLEKRATWAQRLEQDQHAVVFLGDSITQGWGDDFSGHFPGMKIANRGISGDTTRGLLLRLEQDVLALHPQAVVLLIGTNDLEEKAEPETIAANTKLLLAALKAHDPKMPVVLCQVFPSAASKDRPANKITKVNELYAAAVKGDAQVTLLETWPLFADAQGDAQPVEFPDLLHPNEAGYAKWAAALRPVLATLGFLETAADAFAPEPGFVSLFNGRDLTGWGYRPTSDGDRQGAARWQASDPHAAAWPFVDQTVSFDGQASSPEGRFVAKHGRLIVTTPPEGRKIQQLWTTKEFPKNFTLRLEFRATPNADSGVFLRQPQLQCRDYPLAGPYKQLKNYRAGQWNEMEVTAKDGVAHCTCNGEVLETAMKLPATGPIGLEGDRGQMEYRRIRLRELP